MDPKRINTKISSVDRHSVHLPSVDVLHNPGESFFPPWASDLGRFSMMKALFHFEGILGSEYFVKPPFHFQGILGSELFVKVSV